MSHAPSHPSRIRSRVLRFFLRRLHRLGIFLVWYVLSIGPLFWQWHHAQESGERTLIGAFYLPLATACEISPLAKKIVNAYVDLWIL